MKYLSYILRLIYWRRISGIRHLQLGGFIQVSKKNTITLNGRSFFGKGCYLGANIQAEGDLLVGPGVFFVGGDHRIPARDENTSYFASGRGVLKDIVIEKNVWIGANAVIMAGVTLAEGTIVAAGSTITKSTESYAIYGSSAQRKIKTIQ
jgi:acetyltransferase-like isoleucine patch superfamily enzyme